MKLKNKIEEIEKNCPHKYEGKICVSCVQRIKGIKEAQKLMDETLKNIIDEIDHTNFGLEDISKEQAEQIIQKHSQGEVTKGIASHKNEIETPSKFSRSTKPDNSILDDFCEELEKKLISEGFVSRAEKNYFYKIVRELKEKHGAKQ